MINLELPDLPYSKDALAPYMSAETLELHHDKHHMAYVTNGNKFIKENNFNEDSIEDIVKNKKNKFISNKEIKLNKYLYNLVNSSIFVLTIYLFLAFLNSDYFINKL